MPQECPLQCLCMCWSHGTQAASHPCVSQGTSDHHLPGIIPASPQNYPRGSGSLCHQPHPAGLCPALSPGRCSVWVRAQSRSHLSCTCSCSPPDTAVIPRSQVCQARGIAVACGDPQQGSPDPMDRPLPATGQMRCSDGARSPSSLPRASLASTRPLFLELEELQLLSWREGGL